MQTFTINIETGKFVRADSVTSALEDSARPYFTEGLLDIYCPNFVTNTGAAYPISEGDTLIFAADLDFIHIYDSGTLAAAITEAVTEITLSGLENTPEATGTLLLDDNAVRIDYTAVTASGDNWVFTVEYDPGEDSYDAGTGVDIEDPLMVVSDSDQFNISGDRSDLDLDAGKNSFRGHGKSRPFSQKLLATADDDGKMDIYCEMILFKAGSTEGIPLLRDWCWAFQRVMTTEGSPGSEDPAFLNAAQINAKLALAPELQFSIDASDWHDTQTTADLYYRQKFFNGQWSAAIALVQGPTGATGATGENGQDLNPTGEYDAGTTYNTLDLVSYNGSSYVSLVDDNTGNNPETATAYWMISAEKGNIGATGATGADGVDGADGADAYVYVAYASSDSGDGWSLTPTDSLKYRAEIHSTIALTPVESDFSGATWVKYIGNDGADGTGFTNQGEYASGTTYATNDAVTYNGSMYVSLTDSNTGNDPASSSANWLLMVSKGDTGATGDTGPQGEQGIRGIQGIQGIQGETGATGATGTISSNTGVIVGDGTDQDYDITINNGDANPPKIRWNSTNDQWEYSIDGTTFKKLISEDDAIAYALVF